MWINPNVCIKISHRVTSSGFTQSLSTWMIVQWSRRRRYNSTKMEKYLVLTIADRHRADPSYVFQRSANDWLSTEVSPWFNIETPTLSRRSSCPFRTAGQQANFAGNPVPLTSQSSYCEPYRFGAVAPIHMHSYIYIYFGLFWRRYQSSCLFFVWAESWPGKLNTMR